MTPYRRACRQRTLRSDHEDEEIVLVDRYEDDGAVDSPGGNTRGHRCRGHSHHGGRRRKEIGKAVLLSDRIRPGPAEERHYLCVGRCVDGAMAEDRSRRPRGPRKEHSFSICLHVCYFSHVK